MKSQKITGGDGHRRWYDDACGAALALEFIGERWSLLILRELMFGPRRFGEIRKHLVGISANVLTQRLAGLAAAGLLERALLLPPASTPVYALTPWGLEIEPVLQAMGRWATRSPQHDPAMTLSPASTMLSLRTMIDPANAAGLTLTVGFRLGDDRFIARLVDGELRIVRGDPDEAEIVIATDPTPLAFWIYGKRPLAEAEAEGTIRITGDRGLAERFATLFALPPKIARTYPDQEGE
jgi:DNA-binding HxlR family transcriptional regulator